MLVWVIIIMLTLLLLGYPMKVPLLGGALFIFVFYFPNLNKLILAQQTINGVKPISLVAVPMFIFAADIITYGESANKLLDFIRSLIGHIRGGFAITTCASCTAFGAISGSTQA
ncbi:MAG: TRAP transporter permease, partial [Desulfobacterales bacterium]|nr:TRAP transporter permease [Desulfobacterales bacterium]